MENAPIPESFSPHRPLTHDEAKEAKGTLETSITTHPTHSSLEVSLGTLLTGRGFIVTIRTYDQASADIAESLAKKYIPGIPFEIRVIGSNQAG